MGLTVFKTKVPESPNPVVGPEIPGDSVESSVLRMKVGESP